MNEPYAITIEGGHGDEGSLVITIALFCESVLL